MPATRTPRTTTTPAPAAVNGTRNAPAPATAAPGPDTGRGGPGSRQRVLTALAGRPQGATVAELAAITGLGTSTVGKALTAAETDGKVTRVPGGRDGARRAPTPGPCPTTTAQPTTTTK